MVKVVIAIAAFIWALVVSGMALFLPPQGEIDQSVLILIAQLLVLSATMLGVESYVDNFRAIEKNGTRFNSREQPKVKE